MFVCHGDADCFADSAMGKSPMSEGEAQSHVSALSQDRLVVSLFTTGPRARARCRLFAQAHTICDVL